MLIQFNAEVWMGILNWLLKYRKEMAEKFYEFGDVKFSHITQTWLHEWTRNVSLGELEIDEIPRDQFAMLIRNEIPLNITDFSSIAIRLDAEALQFLGQIQSLLANVYLDIDGKFSEQSKFVLRRVLPLLNRIDSFLFSDFELLTFFHAEIPTQLSEARILGILLPSQEEHQDSILGWLFNGREDVRPKTLFLATTEENPTHEFLAKIRQQFLDAPLVRPLCFFVRINVYHLGSFEATNIQNSNGEQLVMQKKENVDDVDLKDVLLIARCSADVGKEWLAEKFKELVHYDFDGQKRRIDISSPEIGQVVEALDNALEENEQLKKENRHQSEQLDKALEEIAQLKLENAKKGVNSDNGEMQPQMSQINAEEASSG